MNKVFAVYIDDSDPPYRVFGASTLSHIVKTYCPNDTFVSIFFQRRVPLDPDHIQKSNIINRNMIWVHIDEASRYSIVEWQWFHLDKTMWNIPLYQLSKEMDMLILRIYTGDIVNVVARHTHPQLELICTQPYMPEIIACSEMCAMYGYHMDEIELIRTGNILDVCHAPHAIPNDLVMVVTTPRGDCMRACKLFNGVLDPGTIEYLESYHALYSNQLFSPEKFPMYLSPTFQVTVTVNTNRPQSYQFGATNTIQEIVHAFNVKYPYTIWTKSFSPPTFGITHDLIHHDKIVYATIESSKNGWEVMCKTNKWSNVTDRVSETILSVCGTQHSADWCELVFFEGDREMKEISYFGAPLYVKTQKSMPLDFVKNLVAAAQHIPVHTVNLNSIMTSVTYTEPVKPNKLLVIVRFLSSVFYHEVDSSFMERTHDYFAMWLIDKFARSGTICVPSLADRLVKESIYLQNKRVRDTEYHPQ